MLVLGVIPARGGSKGLPGKNVAILGGKPLIAWTIEAARASETLTRTIVSTDDSGIASAARLFGGEVPFARPSELARDESGMIEVLRHAVLWAERKEGRKAGIIVLLQPTSPFRTAAEIDALVKLAEGADSAQTVALDHSHPTHRFTLSGKDLKPFFPGMEKGGRRQDASLYRPTGAAYAMRRGVLMEQGRLIGARHRGLVCPPERSLDIDGPLDLAQARALAAPARRRVVATIEARMGSSRLPKKTMMDLAGEPLLYRVVERVRLAATVDEVVVATTDSPKDDVLARFCRARGIACHRGSEDDVLRRVAGAARAHRADVVVQLGADCPFYDPALIDRVVAAFLKGGCDYAADDMKLSLPLGVYVHAISMDALAEADLKADKPRQREDTPRYVWDHPERFKILRVEPPAALRCPKLRLTVDYAEDLEVARAVYGELYPSNPRFGTAAVLALLDGRPELSRLNAHCVQRSAAHVPEKS